MSDPTYYETMYILRPDIPEDEVESHLSKYTDLLKKAEVQVLDSQMRGKRRLAYPISKHKEGIYVQLSHQGNGQQVAILEKAMRLSEDVIRYLTVKQEGPLPTPKANTQVEEKKDEETKEIKEEAKIEEKADDKGVEKKEEEKKTEAKATEESKKEKDS
ncbi:30S ribosomal protein S6 [Prochlorococcus sp. MIT 1223]|uniref:30S ribosomal protein S6 n=1 Tax=Prochlorococcus sp. MIT 1223 TaxID=3096217 RepID=UPI002A749550|nr:30S ribosomal protein S6 [Prochlorococcus sp. MIT 1223]